MLQVRRKGDFSDKQSARPNVPVSHAFFVGKFGSAEDAYPRIPESPTFADSENHAGIQIADLLCSAVAAPLATAVCRPDSPRADKRFLMLRNRCGERMERMLFPYRDDEGIRRRGLDVSPREYAGLRLLRN